MAVINQDHSPASYALIRSLDATPKLSLKGYDNLDEARHDMIMRELFAIIIIPTDFEKKLLNGKNVTVPVYGDATNRLTLVDKFSKELMQAYQQLLDNYNGRIFTKCGF